MLFIASLAILIAAHLVCAVIVLRRSRGWIDRTMVIIALASLMVGFFLTLTRIFAMPIEVWNEARLANAVAMLKGYSLYGLPGRAPMQEDFYGPVGAIAYLPAALMARFPTIALLSGGLLAAAYFFIPAAVFIRKAAPSASSVVVIAAMALFVAMTNLSETLTNPSSWIHTDAPALGLAACALSFAIGGRSFNAMLCAALACWTKQTMAPLLLVVPIWSAMIHGKRASVRDLGVVFTVMLLLGAIFACAFGPRAMLFQMLIEPLHLPWQRIETGRSNASKYFLWQMWQVTWPFIICLAVATLLRCDLPTRPRREFLARNRWLLPAILAFAMAPTAFLAWIKAGGESNNAAAVTYFLALAACAAIAGAEASSAWAQRRRSVALIKLIIVLLAAHLTARSFFADRLLDWRLKVARNPWNNSTELAIRYERAHPGEIYFPWNLQAALVGSGKLYHFDYALHDRIISGYVPSDAEIRAFLPPRMRAIAYPPIIVPSMEMLGLLKEYDQPMRIPELPGFVIFGRKEQP